MLHRPTRITTDPSSRARVWSFAERATGTRRSRSPDERARPEAGLLRTPQVRLRDRARLVVIGIVLAAIAIVTGRWGLLVAAIITVGIGAAFGPARIRR